MSQKQTLSIAETKHIARLAGLSLSEKKIRQFQKELSSTLVYISRLKSVQLENILPTSQVTGLENVWREDKISRSLTQKQALANAPKKWRGYFKIKAIF